MNKRKTLFSRSVGLLSRSVMRTGAIVLTRRARLEAISAAISWFLKFIRYESLELNHESDFGDFHLMSDGKRIQLTWWLTDKPLSDDAASASANDNGNGQREGSAAENTRQSTRQTTRPGDKASAQANTSTSSSTNKSNCCGEATLARNNRQDPTSRTASVRKPEVSKPEVPRSEAPRPEVPKPKVTERSDYEVAEIGFQRWLTQLLDVRDDAIKDTQPKNATQDPRARGNPRAPGSNRHILGD